MELDKWDENIFVEAHACLMNEWNIDQLTQFLIPLSKYIEQKGVETQKEFDLHVYVPTPIKPASSTEIAEKELWKSAVLSMVELMAAKVDGHNEIYADSMDLEALKNSFGEYCKGYITLDMLGASSDNVKIDKSFFSSTGGWSIEILEELHSEYISFLKIFIGAHGIKPFKVLMAHLKELSGKIVAEASKGDEITTQQKKVWEVLLHELFDILAHIKIGNDNALDVSKINLILDSAIKISGANLNETMKSSLVSIKFADNATNSLNIDQEEFTSHILKQCNQMNSSMFDELLYILKEIFQAASKAWEAKSSTKDGIEKIAIQEVQLINQQKKDLLDINQAAESGLNILTRALEAIYPDLKFNARLSLCETSASHLSSSTDSDNHEAVTETEKKLVFVATTKEYQGKLVNESIPVDFGYEGTVMSSIEKLKKDGKSKDPLLELKNIELQYPEEYKDIGYLGIPMISTNIVGKNEKVSAGVLSLGLYSKTDYDINKLEVLFIEVRLVHIFSMSFLI